MELALSLGDTPKPFSFLDHHKSHHKNKDVGICMGLIDEREEDHLMREKDGSSLDPPLKQLDLLPFSPVLPTKPPPPNHVRFPWLSQNLISEVGKGLEVKRVVVEDGGEDGAAQSSPNSAVSSFQMDFSSIFSRERSKKRDLEVTANVEVEVAERTFSRGSDEEENGSARKKLRLSKEQSAFLEESFKEHNTLNPKQKLALAKELNLRPRQVEVWFQNRRARTKLKQTEVDCEYLKRCCETLTEENRRLQKELQDLRALKSSQPFYMQLPATTLTMCPSCERVSTTTTSATTTVARP